MEELDLVATYGFYRTALNDIRARMEGTEDDTILGKLHEASESLRAAFLEEVFPDLCEMEEGYRFPPLATSADLAQEKTDAL
jgi:hypothetical protein